MDPNLVNVILIAVIVLIVGLALFYIYKQKKAGAACIGCPYAKECASKCKCNSKNNQISGGGCCH